MAFSEHVRSSLELAIRDLSEDDEDAWSKASSYIGALAVEGITEESCLPRLVELLHDDRVNESICFALEAYAMNGLYDASCIPRLADLLDNEATRFRALGTLVMLGERGIHDASCLRKAIALLDDGDAEVRSYAAALLAWLARDGIIDPASLPKLVGLFAHDRTKWNSCLALCFMAERGVYDPSCLDRVIDLLDDPNAHVRREAAGLIGPLAKRGVSDPKCLPKLVKLLDDDGTKQNGCCALGMLAEENVYDPSCLGRAIDMLMDRQSKVRNEAAALVTVLAMKGAFDPKCIPRLIGLLGDERTRHNADLCLRLLAYSGAIAASPITMAEAEEYEDDELEATVIMGAVDAFLGTEDEEDRRRALNEIIQVIYGHQGRLLEVDRMCLHRLPHTLNSLATPSGSLRLPALRAMAALAYKGIAAPSSVAILERVVEAGTGHVKDTAALALYRMYSLGLDNGHTLSLYAEHDLQALDEASRSTWLDDNGPPDAEQ